jgi:hypothetical protein
MNNEYRLVNYECSFAFAHVPHDVKLSFGLGAGEGTTVHLHQLFYFLFADEQASAGGSEGEQERQV